MSRILTTEETLLNYAAWYAMRYFPSLQKLRESLMRKSANNTVLTEKVMQQMSEYISEERIVDGLVRMYVEQSKTRPYIEQKLHLKKFGNEIIVTTLESYRDSFVSWNTYEQTITRKIHDYLAKNKSRKYISGTLVQKYPNFKREIATFLDTVVPDETEAVREEFQKLAQKYSLTDRKEQQKIIQKLSMKGFSYDAIKKVMKERFTE
ncbi:MAG: RecX family transcriptional regulator [Candidatus Gracilibacteria bacterium]|nr:RecX family transcriptional regulator [Candidatus Gracilibacteria bacterium]